MPSLFSRLKGKDGASKLKSKKGGNLDQLVDQQPPKPRWEDAYARITVEPEEIQELIRRCTEELKARGTTPQNPVPQPLSWLTSLSSTLQPSTTHSFSCPSDRLRTPAPCALSSATISTTNSRCAARRWHKTSA